MGPRGRGTRAGTAERTEAGGGRPRADRGGRGDDVRDERYEGGPSRSRGAPRGGAPGRARPVTGVLPRARGTGGGYGRAPVRPEHPDRAIGSGDDENEDAALADLVGEEDPALGLVEDFHSLAPLVEALGERDRLLLHLRFVEELTQTQIGERLGVSQMHVSRLLARSLGRLRNGMTGTTAGD
ncbi:RNA polymerase sigma factor (sigma-70 family) [Streptomyces sp. PanSC19]|nr:RNA polymerase sigma factor (sigma-70 family) [Streptomyces sp. PanSC19]